MTMIRKCGSILLCGFIITLSAFKRIPKNTEYIVLQNERLNARPSQFYIAGVTDERKDDTSIGNVLATPAAQGKAPITSPVDVKGGIAAIRNFIAYSLPVNRNLRPLVIKLNDIKLTETAQAAGRVAGNLKVSVSFGLQRGEDFVHLSDYIGTAEYQRPAGPAQQVEPLLRSALSNCVAYINNWMNIQAAINPKLATGVKVSFIDFTEANEGDTIYYNPRRPLTWDDFQEKHNRVTHHGAEVFAGIGYDEDVKLINGIFEVTLSMKVYVPKSASWVSNSSATSYALNHEQRHFDIAKVVAERFKRRIAKEKLDPANYDGPINVAYLDALREMDALQKQYDGESDHSINRYEQEQWNTRIDAELKEYGVKPGN